MEIIFRKSFQKDFNKLGQRLQEQTQERVRLFRNDPSDPQLRLHRLKGDWDGHYSITVAYDLRAIFYFENNRALFIRVGSHSQLYE